MKAAFYESTGSAHEVLRLDEMPTPVPGPGDVRVKVTWSGVNPSDVKSRACHFRASFHIAMAPA